MNRPRLALPIVSGLATVLALAVGEIVARQIYPGPASAGTGPPASQAPVGDPTAAWLPSTPPARGIAIIHRLSPNPELVYELLPSSQVTVLESDQMVNYRVNSLGMRGGETTVTKPEGVFRILTLGDSITFGLEVAEEDTLAVRLDKLLAARVRADLQFDVLDGGVSGYNTHQELTWLREFGLRLQPDLVILNFSDNDILPPRAVVSFESITRPVPLSAALFADQRQFVPAIDPAEERPTSPAEPQVSDPRSWLKQRFRLYDLAALRWHQLLVALGARPGPVGSPQESLQDPSSPEWAWLRERYLAMRDLLASQGSPMVLWHNYPPADSGFAQLAATSDIVILNIAPLVRQHPDAASLFRPYAHLSGSGNQLVAEALLTLLIEKGVIP